ncbi:hypothetical protein [Candidatus Pyrohabitans sp.]
MNRVAILFLTMVSLLILPSSVFAISYTLSLVSSSSVNLYTGERTTSQIQIKNNNWWNMGHCKVRSDTSSWSSKFNVDARSTVQLSVYIYAPPWGSGSGSIQRKIYSRCYDSDNSTIDEKYVIVTIYYTEHPTYIAKTNADSTRDDAQSAISSASSSISSAQNDINEAKNLGADVSNALLKLTNAQNNLQTAQNKMSISTNYYNQDIKEGYDLATTAANEAASYARMAKSDADSARTLAIQAKELIIQAKNNTQMAINRARAAIDSANSLISAAQAVISEAKSIGADVIQSQTLLDTAKSKVDSASSKYNDAVSQFNLRNYNDAKQYAEQAEALAIEAQASANSAKSNALSTKEKYQEEKGQAKIKLKEAQKKYNEIVDLINQTNTLIIRLSEMGIDASSFKQEIEGYTGQILDAKGEVEKAERRYRDGDYDESKSYSTKSLDITEKIESNLNNILYNMALRAQAKALKKQNESAKLYEVSSGMVEKFKNNITGAQFSEFKDNLATAGASIKKADELLKEGDSLLNNKNYVNAVNSYRNAFSESSNAFYLSSKVSSALNSTVQKKIAESKGVCGPTMILLFTLLPLAIYSRKRFYVVN